MLRVMGVSLVLTSVLSLLAALQSIAYYLHESWFHWDDLASFAYSGAFAVCGVAVGVLLVRRTPANRGTTFWIALLGVGICAPLVVIHIMVLLFAILSGRDHSSLITIIFFNTSSLDGWWPPPEFLFCDTLMYASSFRESLFWYGAPFHEPLKFVCAPKGSLAFWTYVPLAICAQAIWGRTGNWADRLFALLAVLLSVLLVISAAEIAWHHYQQATYLPDPGTAIDYLYLPKLSWYAYYATVILWLSALAILLVRRMPAAEELAETEQR